MDQGTCNVKKMHFWWIQSTFLQKQPSVRISAKFCHHFMNFVVFFYLNILYYKTFSPRAKLIEGDHVPNINIKNSKVRKCIFALNNLMRQ